jgi:CRISPR-associated endonuclease Csn1
VQYKTDYKKDTNGNYLKDNRGNRIVDKYYYKEVVDKEGVKKKERIPLYERGDTVRGSLHKETYYGAIKREVINKKGEIENKVLYVVRKPLDSLGTNDIKNIVDDAVREKVQCAVDQKGLKQALSEPIWMNEEKQIPIKTVRCYTPTVTNPIHLKKHRDKSKDDYKQSYHVCNDGNYLMAIYEAKDAKGKIKRNFEIINNLEAGKYFKYSAKSMLNSREIKNFEGLIPAVKQAGKIELQLKVILKTGTIVLFWKDTPSEIWELNKIEKRNRMYKIIKQNKDGRIAFK